MLFQFSLLPTGVHTCSHASVCVTTNPSHPSCQQPTTTPPPPPSPLPPPTHTYLTNCRISGTAAAGTAGDTAAIIMAGRVSDSALLSIGGRAAPRVDTARRTTQLLLELLPGAPAPRYAAMPGAPPLGVPAVPTSEQPAAAAAGEEGSSSASQLLAQLGRAGTALAALALALALLVAPGQLLGGVFSGGAEGVSAALLDVFVFGYVLLQARRAMGAAGLGGAGGLKSMLSGQRMYMVGA